jgi:hypothetical protein
MISNISLQAALALSFGVIPNISSFFIPRLVLSVFGTKCDLVFLGAPLKR